VCAQSPGASMKPFEPYLLRIAWICGLVSSGDYVTRVRLERFGPEAVSAAETALKHVDRLLLQERVAIVLFLIGIAILTYTVLNAPFLS